MKWEKIDIGEEKLNKLMTIVPKVSKLIKEEVEKISSNGKERIVLTHILIDSLHRSDEMSLRAMGLEINEEYK